MKHPVYECAHVLKMEHILYQELSGKVRRPMRVINMDKEVEMQMSLVTLEKMECGTRHRKCM